MTIKLTLTNRHLGFKITVNHDAYMKWSVVLHDGRYWIFNNTFRSLSEAARLAREYSTWTEKQFEDDIEYSHSEEEV